MFEKVNIAKNCFRLQILVLEKNAGMERFAWGMVPDPDAYVLHAA